MSHSRFSILKDVNDKPIPQYWNPTTSRYEVVVGKHGLIHSIIVDSNGVYVDMQDIVDQINNQIIELTRVVENSGI